MSAPGSTRTGCATTSGVSRPRSTTCIGSATASARLRAVRRCGRCHPFAARGRAGVDRLARETLRDDAGTDPHPRGRADARSRGLRRRHRAAADRMAARSMSRSMRAGSSCTRRTRRPTRSQPSHARGAGVVLCPTTEANLGDGVPDLQRWLDAGVPLSIGSDSQVTRDWREELRLAEYGQRLVARRTQRRRGDVAIDGRPAVRRTLDGGGAQRIRPLGLRPRGARRSRGRRSG